MLVLSIFVVLCVCVVFLITAHVLKKKPEDKIQNALVTLGQYKTKEAVDQFSKIIKDSNAKQEDQIDSLWNLATLFQFGDSNVQANEDVALQYYQQLLRPDYHVPATRKVDVMERIVMMDPLMIHKLHDDPWIPNHWLRNYHLPPVPEKRPRVQHRPAFETPRPVFETPRPVFETPRTVFETPRTVLQTQHDNRPVIEAPVLPKPPVQRRVVHEPVTEPVLNPPVIRSDPQNTHNSGVVRTLAKSIRGIKDDTYVDQDNQELIKDIELYIAQTNELDDSQKTKALKTLQNVSQKDEILSTVDMSEADVLNIVWSRIKQNHKDDADLKTLLVKNLAESIENDVPVCVSGRISRMVDTLQVVDDKVKIMPDWQIRSEMLSKASKIHTELLSMQNEDVQKALDGIEENPEKQQDILKFGEEFRKKVRDTFVDEYVAPGIVSQAKLDAELNEWLDSI
jgi:hypothetical protein